MSDWTDIFTDGGEPTEGDVLVAQRDGTDQVFLTVGPPAATEDDADPTFLHHPPTGFDYSLDLEFETDETGDFTTYGGPAGGTAALSWARHGATLTVAQQSNDVGVALVAFALEVGDYLETAMSLNLFAGNYWQCGLAVTDGTVGASNFVGVGLASASAIPALAAHSGTIAASLANLNGGQLGTVVCAPLRLRIRRVDSNTYECAFSVDGGLWNTFDGWFTGDNAMTPTHVGFYGAGGYDVNSPCMFRFEYLRKYQ